MSEEWQERMHDAIAAAVRDSESEQAGEVLTAWVLVAETRDADGDASIGYYRGPQTAAMWLHRGMLRQADDYLAGEADREDED